MEIKPIAYIENDFKDKFGIPRQSGRTSSLKSKIVFMPEYQVAEALKGIEQFSHLWLIFDFSLNHREKFSPTVRPPRLGGNKRVGVFASRSPFRPNNLGLSVVRLEKVLKTEKEGTVLIVSGADILSGSPIYDVKPYLPAYDSISSAVGGYSDEVREYRLEVDFPENLLNKIPSEKRRGLIELLADDPRPSYQTDDKRIYKMSFDSRTIEFSVKGDTLTVTEIKG